MGGTKALGGNKFLFMEQKERVLEHWKQGEGWGKLRCKIRKNVNLGFVFQATPLHTFQSRYQAPNFTYVSIKKQLFSLLLHNGIKV